MIKMATPADEEQEKKIDLEEVEAKEETEEEEVEEGDEEEESADDDDDENDDDQEAEDGADEKEEIKATPTPQQAVKAKKKQDDVLNLNNEVVKMRKDVKRVRALIIRKLISQIAALKKRKGKEMEVERNQRRAARLLEEIHAMKILVPDLVTKTALQKSLNFDQVCKNPKSTISDRAIARIATHPQFNKKIEQIKAAVKAFKEERMKGGKHGGKVQGQNQAEKSKLQSKGSDGKGGQTKEEKDEDTEKASIDKLSIEDKGNANISADTVEVQEKKTPETESIKPASIKNCEVIETVKCKPQSIAVETKPCPKPVPALIQKKEVEAESDLESSSSSSEDEEDEEEKEYFDDSTEERFHKQSSGSESDDDDFFLGKVSKFKKKKKTSGGEVKQTQEVKGDTTSPLKTSDPMQSELDELESRLKSKATSLKSVFCSSLSGTKQSRGGGGGRGGNKFSKQRGGKNGSRDFSKQSKFQNQDKSKEGLKFNKPCPEDRHPDSEERGFASAGRGRGRGRGRGDFTRQRDHRGGGVISHQAPQQALHPSWEASKKRKEQQGQIQAFQGKKIKFDDDD